MKFYRFIAAFLLLKDKKLNKLVVALKFVTVLNLNSNVCNACKDPTPLHKSSKRRNHIKPEYLETLFVQSALRLPIKSH